MRYAMIMAGGVGTRLWPMSRKKSPKQLLPFINGRSLLQIAVERIEQLVPGPQQLICTGESFRQLIKESMPQFSDEQILGEPEGRDTVNAIGLTAAVLLKNDPDAVFVVLTADHIIEPEDRFRETIEQGIKLVEDDPNRLVTFSIEPTRNATEYGYVERAKPIAGFNDAFEVSRFKEKPTTVEEAKSLIDTGNYAWNSGMFVFSAAGFMRAMEAFYQESVPGLNRIADAWGTENQKSVIEEVYPTLPKKSVDYAIMEPASTSPEFSVCTVRMQLDNWLDVGSWPSFAETLTADDSGNRSNTKNININSSNVLTVSSDQAHTITTIGCKDIIIIHTPDATLVCPASEAQRVKDMTQKVSEELK